MINLRSTATSFVLLFLALTILSGASFAGEAEDKAFERIRDMSMERLTDKAGQLLEEKYPDHDWEGYDFPSYVFTNESVETGYRIAVVEPELLAKFKCYCFCDAMGHADLRWCFLKEGELEKGFDPHGADCNICYGQAMMALLWQEAGISTERMTEGFEKRYEQIIERFGP